MFRSNKSMARWFLSAMSLKFATALRYNQLVRQDGNPSAPSHHSKNGGASTIDIVKQVKELFPENARRAPPVWR